jgi:tetratricopeptide (TPR) repeat protein
MAIRRRKLIRTRSLASASPEAGRGGFTEPTRPTTAPAPEASLISDQPNNAPADTKATQTPEVKQKVPVNTNDVNLPLIPADLPQLLVIKNKLSLLQIGLISGVILSAALLTYSLVASKRSAKVLAAAASQSSALLNNPKTESDVNLQQAESQETTLAQQEALSLQLAESYYAAKDYDKAFIAYTRLRQNLASPDLDIVRDFFQFRMALCLREKGQLERAHTLLINVAQSRSVLLQAIANYTICNLELSAGQYLKAHTRAYKVIALTGALTSDRQWAEALERDCGYLAAEALTRQSLSVCDADKELPDLPANRGGPQSFQQKPELADPLTGLDETHLRAALNQGIELLNTGLLAPQIRIVDKNSSLKRWFVVCNGPGIEELLTRFASNASLDVKWDTTGGVQKKENGDTILHYTAPVICYLPVATTEEVVTTTAAAAGLLADVNDAGVIIIRNPAEYTSLSEHSRLLNDSAIWLWRKLLLAYGDDEDAGNAHFSLGILHSRRGRPAEAIAEYKLVASRFPRSDLAPLALLRCSRIKTMLRNFDGASSDLKQLIEQYPDNQLIGQANIELAQTTLEAGFFEQACSLFRKSYNIGFSTESKTIAALGAGTCYYKMNDYESAIKWLNRYLGGVSVAQAGNASTDGTENNDLYRAYLFLGKSHLAMGNIKEACGALQKTVASAIDSDDYIEAITALVEAQIKEQDYVAALSVIENVRSRPFSQQQVTRLLLLKSGVLREMGLPDKAVATVSDRIQYITDSRLKADITLELARCYYAGRNLDSARKYYTDALVLLEPGAASQQASCELAEVCLTLGDCEQTISICTQLLESSASRQIKQRASRALAAAYSKLQQYDKAAQILIMASK